LAAKLQQYYIYKFKSSRLKRANYNISLTIKDARKNGELVSIGDSQILRSLRRLKGENGRKEHIRSLIEEKNRIKKNKERTNTYRLFEIELEIDDLLFCPDIVSVVIDDNRHYKHMVENKFFINNIPFVRLLCGAGNARRNTVIFVRESIAEPLRIILNNGRKDVEITPAKFNAYFSLTASATLPVSEPYFCVIKDHLVTRKESIHYVREELPDDIVEEKEIDIEFNVFDGMGIISPRLAKVWAEDMELDYIPSSFIVRNAFLKGMVAVIDFHKFSEEIGKHIIEDIWGNKVNMRDMDLVLTESQFKLWYAYDSCKDYIDNCRANHMKWGISRYAPKEDNQYVFSNYQFLQVLDLDDNDIENLLKKTTDYFNGIIRDRIDYTLLYLLGKRSDKEYDGDLFHKTHDPVTRALILNNELISDPYIQNYIIRSINKKIRDSYIGNLLLNGNYQIMISDPYAFMEHVFGLPVCGILGKGEHFAHYWNKKKIKNVAACRPPLTWRSEINILNLIKNEDTNHWFQYLHSGIVYNIHGVDTMLHADSDFDGDIVMTTDQEEFVRGTKEKFPISYARNNIPKSEIKEDELHLADMKAFNSRIGFITNCSTTLYSMLPLYEEGTREHNEIINRLIICRKEQGNQIDKTKGLFVKNFPRHWTKWNHAREEDSPEFVDNIDFYNSLLIDKRPYFMRWLYGNYNRKHIEHLDNYNNFCVANFRVEMEELLEKSEKTEEEQEVIDKFYKYSPLLDTDCVMNKICHSMEAKIKELKATLDNSMSDEHILLLKDSSIPFDKAKYLKLYSLFKKYKNGKRNFVNIHDTTGNQKFETLEQYNKAIRLEALAISPDISELANLAVAICYEAYSKDNKTFVWNIFGEGIIDNLKKNRQEKVLVPFRDDDGDILYLDSYYSMKEIDVEKDEDNYDLYI